VVLHLAMCCFNGIEKACVIEKVLRRVDIKR